MIACLLNIIIKKKIYKKNALINYCIRQTHIHYKKFLKSGHGFMKAKIT